MTLAQISEDYEAAASLLRNRLKYLRQMLAQESDPEKIWQQNGESQS